MKFAVLATLLLASQLMTAEEPRKDPEPGSFDVEPAPLPGNLVQQGSPDREGSGDRGQITRKLMPARRAADDGNRLVKLGALSKLEAENRALRVLQLEAQLANEQLGAAEADLDTAQPNVKPGSTDSNELALVRARVAQAREIAERTAATLRAAELDAAALNLQRQRKLLALGSGGKSAVRRAEDKLRALKSQTSQ